MLYYRTTVFGAGRSISFAGFVRGIPKWTSFVSHYGTLCKPSTSLSKLPPQPRAFRECKRRTIYSSHNSLQTCILYLCMFESIVGRVNNPLLWMHIELLNLKVFIDCYSVYHVDRRSSDTEVGWRLSSVVKLGVTTNTFKINNPWYSLYHPRYRAFSCVLRRLNRVWNNRLGFSSKSLFLFFFNRLIIQTVHYFLI